MTAPEILSGAVPMMVDVRRSGGSPVPSKRDQALRLALIGLGPLCYAKRSSTRYHRLESRWRYRDDGYLRRRRSSPPEVPARSFETRHPRGGWPSSNRLLETCQVPSPPRAETRWIPRLPDYSGAVPALGRRTRCFTRFHSHFVWRRPAAGGLEFDDRSHYVATASRKCDPARARWNNPIR
jgi:hypothetical protein